jgi:solute carrier family 50 (sugar transporter)
MPEYRRRKKATMTQAILLSLSSATNNEDDNTSKAITTMGMLVDFCGHLAPLVSIVVFLAPIPTMQQIKRDQSVGSFPLLPYSSMIASTFLWVVYGLLKTESKIYVTNSVGLMLGAYYFYTFIQFAPPVAATLPGAVVQHQQGMATMILLTAFVAMSNIIPSPERVIGFAGVVFCIALFASPLAALRVVIQTKSAKAIPLPFCVASTVNCLLWTVVGIFYMKDINVWLPNSLGLSFSLIQVILKLVYSDCPGGDGKEPDI